MPNFLEISDQNLGGKENYWEIGVSAQCLEQWYFFYQNCSDLRPTVGKNSSSDQERSE